MSERISGGLLCAMAGAAELWLIKLLNRRLAFVRPFRLAVCQKLLEHRKANLAVIQCVAEIAAFVNPSRRNPAERQPGKLLELVFTAARTGISKNCHVRLVGDPEFVQHRATVLPIIPNRNEIKFHLWIFTDDFGPPAGFELGLAVRAPRRPEVNDRGLWGFDGGQNSLFCGGFSTQ